MKKKKKKSRLGLVFLVGVVVVAGAAWAGRSAVFGPAEETSIEGAPVKRGPLRISVVEKGNLKAAESVTLKSEIEGRTTVLYLIDEGTWVEPGEILCELDAAELEDNRVEQEIRVNDREAEFIKAQQNFEIQQSQNLSDIARAERELEFAKIDLQKFQLGDKPQQLQKADEDILLADEQLQRAVQDLEWSEKLHAKGFLEQTTLDADKLAKTQREVAKAQAERAKELLIAYEIPRQEKEYVAEVEEKERELDRVKLQAEAKIADFRADLRTSEARFDLEKNELTRIDEQLGKAVIKAPVAGMVVYAIESHGRWGGGEPMQEGAEIRERQGIITIPSAEGYITETSLHESVLEKVTTGMPCIVTIDALADRTFAAQVEFKALLPDQQSWFANPDLRVYRTEIKILDKDPDMRPGMSSSVEILVDELENALYVPVQAIFLDAGKPIAFVSDAGEIEKRSVEVGQNNSKQVEIVSGLVEGEIVLLSQPPGFTLEPAPERSLDDEDNPWQGREVPAATTAAKDTSAGHGGGVQVDDGNVGAQAETAQAETAQATEGDWEERAAQFREQNPEAAERYKKWMEENPEEAKRIREAMQDPEARKKMMEQWGRGGGQGGGGEGGRPGGDRGGRPNRGPGGSK